MSHLSLLGFGQLTYNQSNNLLNLIHTDAARPQETNHGRRRRYCLVQPKL
jgi:hypothetical protein